MTRVSTAGSYQSALLNLMNAQARATEAQNRVSTQKVATDLVGFGRGAETLTALKGAQSRVEGFMAAGEAVAARLRAQDLSFERVATAADDARQSISEALASGRLDGLMQALQGQFFAAQDGLNATHQGRYLFSGGAIETPPIAITTLGDLADAPAVADVFVNDTLKSVSRIDEGTTLQTGFLADEVGGALFEVFRDIQLYQEGTAVTIDGVTWTPPAAGAIDGQANEDVRAFLAAQLGRLASAHEEITAKAALNGAMQNRVDTVLGAQDEQALALKELVGDRTEADMAQAVSDLELSQIAIPASAQVLSSLRGVSLLSLLPMT